MKNRQKTVWIKLCKIVLNFIIIMGLLPVIIMVYISFCNDVQWPTLFSKSMSLRAFKYVLIKEPRTLEVIITSLKIGCYVTIANILLGVCAAKSLIRSSSKYVKIIESVLLLPVMIPPIVIMNGMYKVFMRMGLTEHTLGVVMAHILPTLPYMIWSVKLSYKHFSYEWEEQGKMLGASRIKGFFYITLPFILPGIIAGSNLSMLISFSQYILTALIGGGQIMTLSLYMFPFVSGGDMNIGAVYSILFVLMSVSSLMILDALLKKYYQNI